MTSPGDLDPAARESCSQRWDAAEVPSFFGYWEAEPDGPPAMLEQMPNLPDLEGALAWGRARARVVLLRVTTRDYYSADEAAPPAGDLPRWPPPQEVLAEIESERRELSKRRL